MSEESRNISRTVVEALPVAVAAGPSPLIRLLGSFDAAEEAARSLHGRRRTMESDGISANPAPGWSPRAASKPSTVCGRRALRRLAEELGPPANPGQFRHGRHRWPSVEDDRLRLILPAAIEALTPEAQIAMTITGGLRADDGKRSPGRSDETGDHCATDRAGQGQIRDARIP